MAEQYLRVLSELVFLKRGQKGVREAAREAGVSPATLSRVENGHPPSLENFRRLCLWLKVSPAEIFEEDDDA